MSEIKYLSLAGLTTYDGLIKTYVDTADQKSIKKVTVSGDTVSFFKSLEEGATADYTVTVPASDVAALKTAVGTATVKDEQGVVTTAGSGLIKRVEDIEASMGEGGSVATQISNAIDALDYTDTAETGKFVTAVSEENGVITVTRAALASTDIPELAISKITGLQDALDGKQATIVWESDNYDASTNKAVTKSDLTAAVAGLTGAMHFKGVKTEVPAGEAIAAYAAGDVILVGTKEYVFDGTTFVELGDEGIYAVAGAIKNADIADDAAIAQTKIAGLTDALAAKASASYVGTASVKDGDTVTKAATGLTAQVEANAAAIAALDVAGDIVEKIQALDSTKEQAAGTDGLALKIVEENGVITEISGSIAAGTYDANGAAAAVQGETTETVASVDSKISAINNETTGILATSKSYADGKIEALDAEVTNAVEEGTQPDVVVSVSEVDGKLTAVTATVSANRFDTYGSASAVQGDTTETVASVASKVNDIKTIATSEINALFDITE